MGILSDAVRRKEFGDRLGTPVQTNVLDWFATGTKDPQQLLDDYTGYIYRCIEVIASNVAAVDLYMERLVGKEWQKAEHPFRNQFLEGDGEQPELAWMREGTVTYKKMVGEAFWYVSTGETSRKPMGRLLLFSDRMQVIADDNMRLIGYRYTTDKFGIIPLEAHEVIHFKYFNPKNHLRGYGPLQAAQVYSDAEQNSIKYVANLMENNAMPSGIVVLPAGTASDQFNAFVAEWRARYSGTANAGKTAFLQGEGVDYKQVSSSFKDLQLDALRRLTREDIMAMFGISKHIIGITDEGGLGRNTAEAHEYIFNKEIVDTEVRREVETLERAFSRYYPQDVGKWRINYVSPIPQDKEYLLNVTREGSAVMTLNERRQLLGLEAMPGGDEIAVNGEVIGLNMKPKITVKMKKITTVKEVTYEQKEQYRLRIQDKQTAYERRYKKALKPFFEKQKNELLDDIGARKGLKALGSNLDPTKEAKEMTDLSIDIFYDLLKEQGQLAIAYAKGDEDFILTPKAQKYIRASLEETSHDFTRETLDKLTASLAEGYSNGESLLDLGDRINNIYKDVEGYRLNRLTRTETLKASNEANQMGYEQLGVTQKEWFANPDCCEFCSAMDGKITGIQENYFKQGETLKGVNGGERVLDYEDIEHPPIHANCRCALLPVRV